MQSFLTVPELWQVYIPGKQGSKQYPVTITLNLKNPQYRAINCPNEFKRLLNSFLELKKYKHCINGVLEYHSFSNEKRVGGLHMHGFVYNRNPPKDNINNLFHFHRQEPDPEKGVKGYIKYSMKDLKNNEDVFRRLSCDTSQACDSPIVRTTQCLFED